MTDLHYSGTLISVVCFLAFLNVESQANDDASKSEKEDEPFYSQLTRAIVRIEEHQSVCVPGLEWSVERDAPVGSAFFIRDSFENQVRFFIVTARHVVESRVDLFARVQSGPETTDQAILILPRHLWAFHPQRALPDQFPIDVAVMRIPMRPFIKAFLNCPSGGESGECGKDENTEKPHLNQLVESPPVMERAMFFGFPGGDVAIKSVEPFARAGVVAYTAPNPEFKIDGRLVAGDSVYFVDAPSFSGNSGGPVLREILPLRSGVFLLGLVTGSSRMGKDYAIVTRPEKIAETLSHFRHSAELSKEAWKTDPPSLPIKCAAEN